MKLAAFALLSTVLVASTARADELAPATVAAPVASSPAPTAADTHLDLGLVLGVATPVGALGVDVQYRPTSWLALGGGAGLGFHGAQVAAMPRLYTAPRRIRGYVGVGASAGRYSQYISEEGNERFVGTAVWANGEAGVEYRRSFFVRLSAGASWMLDFSGDRIAGDDVLPYAGLSVGFSTL